MTRPRRGSVPVELSLVLPVFVALLFATLDWSIGLVQHVTLTLAVQHGARAAQGLPLAMDPEGVATTATLDWAASYGLDPAGITVTVNVIPDEAEGDISVAATKDFVPPVGLLPTPATLGATWTGLYYGDLY